jgi:hypothetical protein
MAVEYSAASREEAQQIADALTQLDATLASGADDRPAATEVATLRAGVRGALVTIRSSIEALARIDADDIFKTNPVFATQRYQLITSIEQTKIDFEFEVLPQLQQLAHRRVAEARLHPSVTLNTEALPPAGLGGGWTPDRLLSSAEHCIDQSTRALDLVSKTAGLIRAFVLLAGLTPV